MLWCGASFGNLRPSGRKRVQAQPARRAVPAFMRRQWRRGGPARFCAAPRQYGGRGGFYGKWPRYSAGGFLWEAIRSMARGFFWEATRRRRELGAGRARSAFMPRQGRGRIPMGSNTFYSAGLLLGSDAPQARRGCRLSLPGQPAFMRRHMAAGGSLWEAIPCYSAGLLLGSDAL